MNGLSTLKEKLRSLIRLEAPLRILLNTNVKKRGPFIQNDLREASGNNLGIRTKNRSNIWTEIARN